MHHYFPKSTSLIAMIHVPALPATPAYTGEASAILDKVSQEARLYARCGIDGILIENMHDTPYLRRQVGPEIVAWMTAVGIQVRKAAPALPCGIQILAGANQAALAVAHAADLQFVRAEGFVFGHLADEGWMNSDAGQLLRYRKQLQAEHIAIWTDIKKKHSAHALTADVSLAETAKAAVFFRTDGLIVTGSSTGQVANPHDVQAVKAACPDLPLWIGSGIRPDNVAQYRPHCQGFIVGSALKKDGYWANDIDPDRVTAMVAATEQ